MKNIRGFELKKRDLEYWFTLYDKWVNQALRAERLGVVWTQQDKIFGNLYTSVNALDSQAEIVREEIIRLEKELQELRNNKQ